MDHYVVNALFNIYSMINTLFN